MHKSLVSKTEGRFDARAPLATFDTIDLGEDIAFIQPSTNDESVSESSDEANKIDVIKKRQIFGKHDSPEFELSNNHVYEKLSEGHGANNVKAPRPENSEFMNQRPSPDDSLSDSSDSDSGYIQSGYLSMTDGRITKHDFPAKIPTSPFPSRYSRVVDHDGSLDNTPTSSPSLQRIPLPVLLQELEHVKLESKRKALEKRIQRLQVTTRRVERPRSTTPINVVTLDEYREISSPEKQNTPDHLEKLKIKLPAEDFSCVRQRSPWKSRGSISEASSVFNFSEEFLFTHTKSAFLLQNDGSVGQSPKRILIPPNLSPALSPAASPVKCVVPSNIQPQTGSPKFYYNPALKSQSGTPGRHPTPAVSNLVRDNWIAFDDNWGSQNSSPAKIQSNTESAKDSNNKQPCVPEDGYSNAESGKLKEAATENPPVKFNIPHIIEHVVSESEQDEILTINIEEFKDGQKICNINVSESPSKDIGNESSEDVSVLESHTIEIAARDGGSSGVDTDQGVVKQEGVEENLCSQGDCIAPTNNHNGNTDTVGNVLLHTSKDTQCSNFLPENQSQDWPSQTHTKDIQEAGLPGQLISADATCLTSADETFDPPVVLTSQPIPVDKKLN
ncbi:hypothetical protein KP79_PYT10141 [Mizuhopecten yessoensis]|uniref:Uncharacterized protein n=1 Tax=Mizuhopecten yessoensis TaxID=6573 RepID=A0A210QAE1_MIZYE|nr:hypothetical protein KP79_PYT10141 [Mizuhopecten yessoensis]